MNGQNMKNSQIFLFCTDFNVMHSTVQCVSGSFISSSCGILFGIPSIQITVLMISYALANFRPTQGSLLLLK